MKIIVDQNELKEMIRDCVQNMLGAEADLIVTFGFASGELEAVVVIKE